MSELYIGLMSGTSLDGVDGALVDFSRPSPHVLGHASHGFRPDLREQLLTLNRSDTDELHRSALAANALAKVYAAVVAELLQSSGLQASMIRAIGAHGQTVRHRPGEFDGTGYTLQINNPALLAELTGVDVVADFRSRDVAAGGQGAPLVPAFHRAVFGASGEPVAVLNLGGIANLTLLNADHDSPILGFDCGPGNVLLDAWCLRHRGQPFDADGAWAASGKVHAALLKQLLSEPYFAKPPPKSSGRDLFNPDWLASHLAAWGEVMPEDVQATLAELTAQRCANDLLAHGPGSRVLIACGGGALNGHVMRRLQAHLPACRVESSARHGLPELQVEATAFAWLARKTVRRETGSLKSVTGARGARVLGAIYPA